MDGLRARASAPGRRGLKQALPLHGRIVPMSNSSSAVSDFKIPPECDYIIRTPEHLVLRTPTTMTVRVLVEIWSTTALVATLVMCGGSLTPLEAGLDPRGSPQHNRRLRS